VGLCEMMGEELKGEKKKKEFITFVNSFV